MKEKWIWKNREKNILFKHLSKYLIGLFANAVISINLPDISTVVPFWSFQSLVIVNVLVAIRLVHITGIFVDNGFVYTDILIIQLYICNRIRSCFRLFVETRGIKAVRDAGCDWLK